MINWENLARAPKPTLANSQIDRNLFNLKHLVYLIVSNIQLYGEIPAEIGKLKKLGYLIMVNDN